MATSAADTFDLVIVGSGGGGMLAGIQAASHGLSAVVVEKAPYFGGSTSMSGGIVWAPNNSVLREAGLPDSEDRVRAYLEATVGDDVPTARREAFLTHAPAMVEVLRRKTPLHMVYTDGYSDYYPEAPGGSARGRGIDSAPFDARMLGPERAHLHPSPVEMPFPMVVGGADLHWMNVATHSLRGMTTGAKAVTRAVAGRAQGREYVGLGQALAAGLRVGLHQAGVPLWLETPMVGLETTGSRVTGVRVAGAAGERTLHARRGVILTAGGFEHNMTLRRQYQPGVADDAWSAGNAYNTGDAITAGVEVGAGLGLMDQAWWFPTTLIPDAPPPLVIAERTLPGSYIVNGHGRRFFNEAVPYMEAGQIIFSKHTDADPHIPCWLIFDQRFRNRYPFTTLLPRQPFPESWYRAGIVVKEQSLTALAGAIHVPPDELTATQDRFTMLAAHGHDDDFGRGNSAYDRYYGDPTVFPNPCLGVVDRPPFYAVQIVPGDIGTCGGLRADEHARVLRDDGSVIDGLYAAGNVSASAMGKSYPGPGGTIGPAMVFAYAAVEHAARATI